MYWCQHHSEHQNWWWHKHVHIYTCWCTILTDVSTIQDVRIDVGMNMYTFTHVGVQYLLMSAPFRTSELMVPWTCTHSHMLVYNTYWCQHHPGCQNWCWQTPGCMSTSHLDCLRARSGHSQPDPSRRLHGQRSWNNTRGALICHDKVQFNTSNQCMMEENVCCF